MRRNLTHYEGLREKEKIGDGELCAKEEGREEEEEKEIGAEKEAVVPKEEEEGGTKIKEGLAQEVREEIREGASISIEGTEEENRKKGK